MDFNSVDNIYIECHYYEPGSTRICEDEHYEYQENKGQRKISQSGCSLSISFKLNPVSNDYEPEDEYARFERKENTTFAYVNSEEPGGIINQPLIPSAKDALVYYVDGVDSDNHKYRYTFEFDMKDTELSANKNEDINMVHQAAKEFISKLYENLDTTIKNNSEKYDLNKSYWIDIKFLNGRTARVQLEDDIPDNELGDIQCIVDCTCLELKKNWTVVSAGITFNIAYRFNRKEHTFILRRAPGDNHNSDEFAERIIENLYYLHCEMIEDERYNEVIEKLNLIEDKLENKSTENNIKKTIPRPRKKYPHNKNHAL